MIAELLALARDVFITQGYAWIIAVPLVLIILDKKYFKVLKW